MPAFKLLGFAPDADPTTPGVLMECAGLIPTDRGMVTAPNPVAGLTVTTPLPSNAVSVAYFEPSGEGVLYAYVPGSGNELFRLYGTTGWDDVGRSGGYSGPQFSMAQFGPNVVLAVCGASSNLLQAQTLYSASFADVPSAPTANLVVTANRFVVVLGHTDPGSTSNYVPDGWYCAARDSHTDWSPSVSTLCGFGRVPGVAAWTAAIEFGDSIYAWTRTDMYRGDFVGAGGGIWQWTKLPHRVGCLNMAAVTKTDRAIVFLSSDNLYLFDGGTLTGLMDGACRQWFCERYSPFASVDTTHVRYDRRRGCVWVAFSDGLGGQFVLVYHVASGRWGRGIEGVFRTYVEASAGLVPGHQPTVLACKIAGHQLFSLAGGFETGTSPACTTWDFGDDSAAVEITDSRLRFTTPPPTTTCRPYTRKSLGETLTAGSVVTRTAEGKFELRQAAPSAQWHRHVYTFSGHAEVTHLWLPVKSAGDRK
jgi:hypothetical protein